MTSAQRRAFRRQWEAQLNEERNGAPIPPEIAARMTQEKPLERLFQVVVERPLPLAPLAVGPCVIREVADELAATINACVAAGREKHWRNATVVAVVGVH